MSFKGLSEEAQQEERNRMMDMAEAKLYGPKFPPKDIMRSIKIDEADLPDDFVLGDLYALAWQKIRNMDNGELAEWLGLK